VDLTTVLDGIETFFLMDAKNTVAQEKKYLLAPMCGVLCIDAHWKKNCEEKP
jgi:hypothetical protein